MRVDKPAPPPDMDADKPSPPPPYQPSNDDPGFLAAKALLGKGVKVALVRDCSDSAKESDVREYGVLTCVAADVKFAAKKPKVRFSTTYLSNVQDVELKQKIKAGQREVTCRIALQEGTAGSSYSFACTDADGELSSSEVTTFVSLVLRDKLGQLQDKKDSGQTYVSQAHVLKPKRARPPSTFEELLAPLGLADKYCAAFGASRIPMQNLSVVTGEDLAELVGVTDRLDQINIRAQIKRCFPDRCSRCSGGDEYSRVQAGAAVMEGAANVISAFIG